MSGTRHFNKPYSEGFDFLLPTGEEFVVSVGTDPIDSYIQVWLVDPKKYEAQVVEKGILDSPFYDSFSLTITRDEIENSCELLTDFETAVYFYSPHGEYGEFSNFSSFGFEYKGLYYPTVEHFYQAHKFSDKDFSEQIRGAKTAKDASVLGRTWEKKLRVDWESIKIDVMTLGVRKKFESHKVLADLLLATGDKLIIENSPYDNFWGIGSSGEGFNQLGTILMRIRETLKNAI